MADARALLACAAVAVVAGCVVGGYEHLTTVEDVSPGVEQCGECHVAIYEEFRASAHAEAWVRPAFVGATSQYRITECLGCHAPASVLVEGVPLLRSARREEGVTCIACHFDGCAMAGPAPASAPVRPHPVAQEQEIFLASELCGKCHEGTFAEWRRAPELGKRSCQDCHMPRVTRTLAQATDLLSSALVALEDEFPGRRHTFHLDAVANFEDALRVELHSRAREHGAVSVALKLENRLPHLIPTGEFGFRRVRVTFTGLDRSGAALATREWELFKELGEALALGEPRTFAACLPEEATALRVTVAAGKESGAEVIFFEQEWSLP
ncbi:MAG: hypothetical protein HY812_13610 [Planctomycetes bacterium]|nr:hypothetical protein [Planctomycetota bacterium]